MTAPAGSADRLRRAMHLAEVGRMSDAVPMLQGLLAEDPGDVGALRGLAYCMEQAGRYADMLALLDRAAAVTPDEPGIHRQRTVALLRLGHPRFAVDAAAHAHRLDPQDFRNDIGLAEALLALGGTANILAAGAACARARQLAPDNPYPHIVDGDVQRRRAEFDRARQAYRRALALDPENSLALYRLGAVDSDRGRALTGSPLLGDTLRAAPNDPEVLRTATAGARRVLWLLTDAVAVLLTVVAAVSGVLRAQFGGAAGVVLGVAVLVLGVAGSVAFLRWRLRRLPVATRALVRGNVWRFTFLTALLRLASVVLGGLLLVTDPVRGPGSVAQALAGPLITLPLLLLLLRARNWLAGEFYYVLRRVWFRVQA